jgi:DNA-binding MarR family transcriptional regulator
VGVDDHFAARIDRASNLYLVKMKSFTMKDSDLKIAGISGRLAGVAGGADLGTDADGCLYLKRFRELFDPLQVDVSAVEALSALRLASHTLGLLQERWAERHGLSSGRLAILFRLLRGGDTHLGELAVALDSTPRNVTGLVDHLERDGLVERVPDPDDRRAVRARLTDKGREQIKGIWREGLTHQYALAGGLGRDDLAQLRHLCLTLMQAAREELGK